MRGSPQYNYDEIGSKFTGKERDSESGLDWFDTRYFSGAQGRFTSPDEPFNDQDPSDPQSWNLYSYVRNNSLRNVDPSGQDCITATNQTATSVTVGVASGTCSGNAANQTYVAGTVNTSSLSYNGSSIGFNYTPDNAGSTLGAGHVDLGPAPSDALSASAQATLGQVGTWTTDRSVFRGAALWMAQIGPVHAGVFEDIPAEEGGNPGSRTAPTLPPKVIAKEGEVEIVHYTRSGDHGPPHVHVRGGGPETRIEVNPWSETPS